MVKDGLFWGGNNKKHSKNNFRTKLNLFHVKKAAGKGKQYSENDKILKSRKMAILQTGMKEKGKKKETKRLEINKGLDITRRKQEKLLCFEVMFHSENELYAT